MLKESLTDSTPGENNRGSSSGHAQKREIVTLGARFDTSRKATPRERLGDVTWQIVKRLRHPAETLRLTLSLLGIVNNDIPRRDLLIREPLAKAA